MRKRSAGYSLRSVERAVDILNCLTDHSSISVEDLSRKVRCPESSVYRLLGVLRRKQLVDRDPETARYRLGLNILRAQRAVLEGLPIRTAALDVIRDLASHCGETVVLTLRRGDFGVVLESIESSEAVRVAPAPGESVPLHCGAPMKVMLAFSPTSDIHRYLRRKLERYTPRTICSPRRLGLHLAEIRAKGYAESWAEVYTGAVGVAAPVLGGDGHALASLAIAGPVHRLTRERVGALAQMLIAAGKDVSRKIQLM